jgi:predicted transcriptional regulator
MPINNNTITANVHNINTDENVCFVTIKDGDEIIVDNKNIGLLLNEDGSANTAWIQTKISAHILEHRKEKTRRANESISVSIGEQKS